MPLFIKVTNTGVANIEETLILEKRMLGKKL